MRVTLERGAVLAIAALAVGLSGCGNNKKKSSSTAAPATSNTPAQPGPAAPGTPSQVSAGATVQHTAMSNARGDHTATSTTQGVIVTGGEAGKKVSASVEIYLNGKWSPGGVLASPRKNHSATLLPSGKLLVVGGQADSNGAQILGTTEIYDPVTRTSQPGPPLSAPRSGHVAVPFRTQQGDFVLLAGGVSTAGSVATAEVYDARTHTITPIQSPMIADRVDASAVALQNGKILIQGGLSGFNLNALTLAPAGAELFDPTNRTFAAAGAMGIDRFGAGLARTDSGQVVALGGNSKARMEMTGEAYDPATNRWSNMQAQLGSGRERLSLTPLPSGQLLAAAGGSSQGPSAAVDLIDPRPTAQAAGIQGLTPLQRARREHTATRLPNGNVLIVGGYDAQGALASAEEYDPTAKGGSTVTAPPRNPTTPPPATTPIGQPQPAAPAPKILAILPTKGKPGDLITIAGQHFARSKKDNVVWFAGNVVGKVLFEVRIRRLPVLGPVETLVVEVPQGAQTGDVRVIASGRASAGKGFRIDMQSGGTPQVLYTLPRRARAGAMVTVFGRNFARPSSGNTVKFNGVPALVIGGITTQSVPFLGNVAVMLVQVPANAATGDLTVEAYGKISRGYGFEVIGTTPGTNPTPNNPTNPGTTPGTGTPTTGPGGTTVFYAEDFEGATVAMSQQGGVWQVARPGAGQPQAASGVWCAGTAMVQGKYNPGDSGYLFTQEIDLTNASTAELRFNQWFETDGVDAGRVIISPDGGNTFYLLRPNGGYLGASIFNPGEGFTGSSGTWLATRFDLSGYIGDKVVIGFQFKADSVDERTGWFVDDIEVLGN